MINIGETAAAVFAASNGLKAPVLLSGTIDSCSPIATGPTDCLRSMARAVGSSRALDDLRVYVDRAQNPAHKQAIINQVAASSELDLATIGLGLWPHKELSVVLNRCETWSEPLARAAAEITAGMQGLLGTSLLHAECLYFIGSSSFTPFGVHIDDAADALHYNFGPADRALHLWSVADFLRLSKGDSYHHDPKEILGHAVFSEAVPAGHWFYLPATRYYHVAENRGHSVSLVLTLIQYEPARVVERAVRAWMLENRANPATSAWVGELLAQCAERASLSDLPLDGDSVSLRQATTDYVLRIRSNCGFRRTTPAISQVNVRDVLGRQFQRVAPFPILSTGNGDGTRSIYARGAVLSCADSAQLRGALGELQSGAPLLCRVPDSATSTTTLGVIAQLLRVGAVEPADSRAA